MLVVLVLAEKSYILRVAISDSYHLEGVSKKNQQKPLKILGSS